ncbi:MAG: glycoside hydrolase family 88 protein [Bacteroidales bacterium]|nr:glycoside hydrolase family 88 protein [Bacteroidales bacterium]
MAQQTESATANPKNKKTEKTIVPANDVTTPLHLLKPDYGFAYGVPDTADVKMLLDRMFTYLNKVTPAQLEDSRTNTPVTDFERIDKFTQLKKGDFRLTSYEWGVTYSAMLRLAEVTGDKKFNDYVNERFTFLGTIAPYFKKQLEEVGKTDRLMTQVLKPHALDDAGAICASMIKASLANKDLTVIKPLIDNYINYIMFHEYRLADGTFARNRPHKNTLWLDDMYMSIPAIVNMGKITGDQKYYNEAARQVKQFAARMFVPEKNLFRHGWVEGMSEHPAFFWARANGWALLTLCDVLDALPESHPSRSEILNLLKLQIKGIAALQSSKGFWHQLLDRNDSYLETSATAIYVYGIAHAINKGWIDGKVYGPAAFLGWTAVSTQINDKGQVEGTCVGTGMGFDPAFYYFRPVSPFAAHGYGPVFLAGAEILALKKSWHPRLNDNAIQFYPEEQNIKDPIFFERDNTRTP